MRMRSLITGSIAALAISFAAASAPALADADPTVNQIYDAASAGHLDEAQRMMDQVLRDHPNSAKAHFVQAEIYAKEGKIALARSEFNQAEQLKPGLPDVNPRAVQELKAQLGMGASAIQGERSGLHAAPAAVHFPWGTVLILALVVGVIWMLFRRRNSYAQYPAAGGAPGGYGPQGYGPGGPGGGYAGPGGGIGSTVAGGLAGGLAAGAGIVAGEELAHHFLDRGQPQGGVIPPANAGEWENNPPNADMGGADFGVDDPGSWDDGGGGGGGDDWT